MSSGRPTLSVKLSMRTAALGCACSSAAIWLRVSGRPRRRLDAARLEPQRRQRKALRRPHLGRRRRQADRERRSPCWSRAAGVSATGVRGAQARSAGSARAARGRRRARLRDRGGVRRVRVWERRAWRTPRSSGMNSMRRQRQQNRQHPDAAARRRLEDRRRRARRAATGRGQRTIRGGVSNADAIDCGNAAHPFAPLRVQQRAQPARAEVAGALGDRAHRDRGDPAEQPVRRLAPDAARSARPRRRSSTTAARARRRAARPRARARRRRSRRAGPPWPSSVRRPVARASRRRSPSGSRRRSPIARRPRARSGPTGCPPIPPPRSARDPRRAETATARIASGVICR